MFTIFFLIACGLGYPVLNRYDPRQTPGLSDVKTYAAIVTDTTIVDAADMRFRRFRVLVPWLARPFYLLARGRIATWDPVMFGLLVAASQLIAGTAVLIVVLGSGKLGNSAAGVLGALLYLLNFAVPNLRLVGLVDAGEGFFLLALLWSLSEFKLWTLPVIVVLGTLTKESFIPFSIAFASAWWISNWRSRDFDTAGNRAVSSAVWIVVSWIFGIAALIVLQRAITGSYANPLQFGLGLHGSGGYPFTAALHDRNLLYSFIWLLPTAIPNLRRLPKSWLIPVTATCAMALVLDAYFGPAPGTMGRELFSIAGPVLSLASARFLLQLCG